MHVTDDASLDEDGRDSGYLRFADGPDVVHWRLTAQQRLRGTRTDFTFHAGRRPAQSVTVYLDGYRFHASREHNQIATDAEKRTLLRAEGHLVFQLTWEDLDLFDGPTRRRPVWPPYARTGQEQARNTYEAFGGARSELAGAAPCRRSPRCPAGPCSTAARRCRRSGRWSP